MKKEFIVSRIEASQDGSPYIYITFSDANDYKSGRKQAAKSLWYKRNGIYFSGI